MILFIIGIRGLFSLKRFENRSKLLIFIAVLVVVIPLMEWTLDFSRTNYHWIRGDGLKAIDIEESNITLSGMEDEMEISIDLEIKDYGKKENKFKIRVYLPESLSDYTDKEFYDLESYYYTRGNRSILTIQEDIIIKLDDKRNVTRLFDSKWFWEDVEYELFNSQEKIRILQHGL